MKNFFSSLDIFNWKNFIAMTAFHVGMVCAFIFYFSWWHALLAATVYSLTLCLGIGVCFHRLLTHRGFKTYKWLEYTLTIFGYLGLQGGAIWWVVWHLLHHAHTEVPGKDPHTPLDGKWWSHMGWLILKNPSLKNRELLTRYANALCQDKFHWFLNRFAWLPTTVFGALVFWLGGVGAVCWGVFVPVVFGWHSTWLVNSATHLWGSRAYEAGGNSRNNWWVAILTFGEGWHNNHHKFPGKARHGIERWQVDVNWYAISLLRRWGLVWDVNV